jgi:uncharacterized damage-inducible protein DinB
MQIAEWMANELTEEMGMTRKLLAKIPHDKLNWQPAADLHTIGWNAAHLVEIISWVPGILTQAEWDIAPVGGEPYVTPPAESTQQLLEHFDANQRQAMEALRGVPDTEMSQPWSLKMGGQTLFTMNKGDCLRKWVFSHSAHHRGVLATYLRLSGVPVTSVYEE